jgi:hypothetical protein
MVHLPDHGPPLQSIAEGAAVLEAFDLQSRPDDLRHESSLDGWETRVIFGV